MDTLNGIVIELDFWDAF